MDPNRDYITLVIPAYGVRDQIQFAIRKWRLTIGIIIYTDTFPNGCFVQPLPTEHCRKPKHGLVTQAFRDRIGINKNRGILLLFFLLRLLFYRYKIIRVKKFCPAFPEVVVTVQTYRRPEHQTLGLIGSFINGLGSYPQLGYSNQLPIF